MPDKVFETILSSLERQLDRNWTLRWDPKTVAEEIKAALHEVSPAEFRSAVQQPGPMFIQYGQPGLIGEMCLTCDTADIDDAIRNIDDSLNQMKKANAAGLGPETAKDILKSADLIAKELILIKGLFKQ